MFMKDRLTHLVKKFHRNLHTDCSYPLPEDDNSNKTQKLPRLFEFYLVYLMICQNVFPGYVGLMVWLHSRLYPLLFSTLRRKHPKFKFLLLQACHLPSLTSFLYLNPYFSPMQSHSSNQKCLSVPW